MARLVERAQGGGGRALDGVKRDAFEEEIDWQGCRDLWCAVFRQMVRDAFEASSDASTRQSEQRVETDKARSVLLKGGGLCVDLLSLDDGAIAVWARQQAQAGWSGGASAVREFRGRAGPRAGLKNG